MHENRKFETSGLTKVIIDALDKAIEHCRDYDLHVSENEFKKLKTHIEKGEFDIRLMSRVE